MNKREREREICETEFKRLVIEWSSNQAIKLSSYQAIKYHMIKWLSSGESDSVND